MSDCRNVGLALCAILAVLSGGCVGGGPEESPRELVVYAAASLRDVLTELAGPSAERTGCTPVFNFAGSNVLALQIEAAPRADVFLSADAEWMDRLEASGLLVPGSRQTFVSNRLVVVAHRESSIALSSMEDLAAADFGHLALGDSEAVPAGRYARRMLEGVLVDGKSLWSEVEDRVVPTPDVRAALGLVESTPEALGIVYRSDVRGTRRVRPLLEVPEGLTPAIRYVAAAVRGRPRTEAAQQYLAYLGSAEARTAYESHGFAPVP